MKTYNWGIIGTGYIAQTMAEALAFVPQARLHVVGSRNRETANDFAAKYSCKAYASYEEVANDPEVDIVYIATPHNLHCQNTLLCIDKGKHVLCEKPLAVNGSEVDLMINAAREKGVFLMEALWTRFNPRIIAAKEVLDSKQLGDIKLLKADFGLRIPAAETSRHHNKSLIGGSVMDLGIYPLFLAQLFMGKPKTITATAGIGPTGVDTNCAVTLGYEGDALAVIYSSILAHTDCKASVYCENGDLLFDKWVHVPEKVTITPVNETPKILNVETEGNCYNYEVVEVMRCIAEGKIESELWSWNDSKLLIDTLDEVRKQIGVVYDGHDKIK